MPGLSHPDEVRERAKLLRESGLSFRAIARQMKIEIGHNAPSYEIIRQWAQGWSADKSGGLAA